MQVIIADNNSESRQALVQLLEKQPGIEVVGEAEETNCLLTLVKDQPANVIVVDYGFTDIPLAELIQAARALSRSLRFVVMSNDVVNARLALNAGADSFVSRNESLDSLLETLKRCDMK